MGWLGCAERMQVQDVLEGGGQRCAEKGRGKMLLGLSVHVGCTGSSFGSCWQLIWELLSVHLGCTDSSSKSCWQFSWELLSVHLECTGSSFGSSWQFTWQLLSLHLGCTGSSLGSCWQFIWELLSLHLLFGMHRQFIWKSWAPKMGRGKMLVLRGKMFGPWTAKGVLRGCSS